MLIPPISAYSETCPAELREPVRRDGRKEIVAARYDFRRPLRLCGFARLQLPPRRILVSFFLLAKTQRPAPQNCGAQRNSSRSVGLPEAFAALRDLFFSFFTAQRPAPQNCGKSYFFLFSRKDAKAQRNCSHSVGLPEAFAALRALLFFFSQSLTICRGGFFLYSFHITAEMEDKRF